MNTKEPTEHSNNQDARATSGDPDNVRVADAGRLPSSVPVPGAPCVKRLLLSQVRRVDSLMMRVRLDSKAVAEYAEHYRREARGELAADEKPMPLCVVFEIDPDDYILSHGWHREEARHVAEIKAYEYEVRRGTLVDAVIFAAAANREAMSVRYTNADKRNACRKLFAALGEVSSNRVAELAGVDLPSSRPRSCVGSLPVSCASLCSLPFSEPSTGLALENTAA